MAGRQQPHHFTALVRAIVGQQLSTKAAATIYGRLEALFPEGKVTSAEAVAQLRRLGLQAVVLARRPHPAAEPDGGEDAGALTVTDPLADLDGSALLVATTLSFVSITAWLWVLRHGLHWLPVGG